MRKVLIHVVAAIGLSVLLVLTSCITLGTPSLPRPHGSNDSLLIVPIGKSDTSVTGSYGNLRLSYEAIPIPDASFEEEEFFVTGSSKRSTKLYAQYPNFGVIRYLKPGHYKIEAVRFVSKEHEYFGKRHDLQNMEFTIESKGINILPYRFIVDYTKPIKVFKSPEYYIFDIDTDVVDIQKLNKEEVNLLREEVSSYNNFELWESR